MIADQEEAEARRRLHRCMAMEGRRQGPTRTAHRRLLPAMAVVVEATEVHLPHRRRATRPRHHRRRHSTVAMTTRRTMGSSRVAVLLRTRTPLTIHSSRLRRPLRTEGLLRLRPPAIRTLRTTSSRRRRRATASNRERERESVGTRAPHDASSYLIFCYGLVLSRVGGRV